MKKLFALILCLCLALGLVGCELPGEDPAVRESVELIIAALDGGDLDAAVQRMDPQYCDKTQFRDLVEQVREVCDSFQEYTLTYQGFHTTVTNGSTIRKFAYQLNCDGKTFKIVTTDSGEGTPFYGFHFSEVIEPQVVSGTFATVARSNGLQILLNLVWVVEVTLMFWMVVDCLKRKNLKQKWLWLLLIWFVTVEPSVSIGSGNFNANVRFVMNLFPDGTGLLGYSNGDIRFQLMVPMGAILYFLLRKKLTEVPSANAPTEASPEESPEPPEEQE